jgi:hypothetical protein
MPPKRTAELKGCKVNQLGGDFMPGLTNIQASNHDGGSSGLLHRIYENEVGICMPPLPMDTMLS